ncbi:YjbF family lipoprotein [Photobacterium sp. GSS17]|uniref:YjbF family lipoprotein n=1 Tax=Photobacterium sp. GSS17 TaxID=3020715 RepID=UPI002360CB87|nr:YjbF family lipoprotein [Photobacterium sp. GSS17]
MPQHTQSQFHSSFNSRGALSSLTTVHRHLSGSLKYFTAICLLSLLAGCSQKFSDVNDTVKLAILGESDIQKSSEDILALPYASMYAQIEDGPQAFMVLALAENEPLFSHTVQPSSTLHTDQPLRLKWLSSDKGMLATENGRLVKTLNLPFGNLLYSQSVSPDPLMLGLHKASTPLQWQRKIDWQPGYHFGYKLNSHFQNEGQATIEINGQPVTALHFSEHVSVDALKVSYTNNFWIDPNTGAVLKSKQKIAPGLPFIELTLLKPYS